MLSQSVGNMSFDGGFVVRELSAATLCPVGSLFVWKLCLVPGAMLLRSISCGKSCKSKARDACGSALQADVVFDW